MYVTAHSTLQESLETQLGKPDILTADLSKIEVRRNFFVPCPSMITIIL